MIDPVISWLIAASGALLFGTAGLHKLRTWEQFRVTLEDYRVLPRALTSSAAFLVILLECGIALGVLWPQTRGLCCLSGAVLLLVYASSMAVNLARGRRSIDCGCSLRPRPIQGVMIMRNAVLAAWLLVGWLPSGDRPWAWTDGLTLAAALLVAPMLYASLDTLLETQWHRS